MIKSFASRIWIRVMFTGYIYSLLGRISRISPTNVYLQTLKNCRVNDTTG